MPQFSILFFPFQYCSTKTGENIWTQYCKVVIMTRMLMWKLGTSQTWWLWWVLNDINITLACSYVSHCWSNNRFGSLMITIYSFNNIWATISHSFATIITKNYKHVHRYWHISKSYLTGNALSNVNSSWAASYNQYPVIEQACSKSHLLRRDKYY